MGTKMMAPEGFTGGSIGGREVRVGSDGTCDVDGIDVATLVGFGFVRQGEDTAADQGASPGAIDVNADPNEMTREGRIAVALELTRMKLEALSDKELIDVVEHMQISSESPLHDKGPNDEPVKILTDDEIAKMSRADMQAFFKDANVTVGNNTSNDDMRKRVVEINEADKIELAKGK